MKLRYPLIVVALVATMVGTAGTGVGQSAELEPQQLRVIWASDPATSATISWSTDAAGSTHVVHYDVAPRAGVLADYAQSVAVAASGEYESGGPYFHHAALQGLEPNTDVYFVVETDGEVSPELHFRTAPNSGAIKLLYGGDSRTGRTNRQKMNRLIAKSHEDDPEIVALVHGGDYIAWANSWQQWSAWLDDHELTISAEGRVLPIVPAKGNHEGRGVMYNAVFGTPSGDAERNWFQTQLGDVALINLDTEASLAGEQRDWLEQQLAAGRDSKWLVVNYHRPAFPAVKSPSGAREHWVPLFEQYDVDLVCESDGHTLKRTPPIRNEAVDFTGVTYVGEGGLGVPQRTPFTDRWYLQSPGMAASAHHLQKIELGEDLLRYQAVLEDGSIADEVTILPRDQRLAHQITAVAARAASANHVVVQLSKPFDRTSLKSDGWELSPNVEIEDVLAGDVVAAVLALVNRATLEELDDAVGLDARAARNLIEKRAGSDGDLGTADDQTIDSWSELDAVSYVGAGALNMLSEYALADADNVQNAITIRVGGLEADETYRVLVGDVADENGQRIAAGTTVSFVNSQRADAPRSVEPNAEDDGGCSSVEARPGEAMLLFFALALVRRRRN